MGTTIQSTILQIVSLPFKIIFIIVVNPFIRFIQILSYGLFILPSRFIKNLINLILLPFNFFKPSIDIDYSLYNILKDFEVLYQFLICSIIFGVCIGFSIGAVFCSINYMLTFTNTEWKLFDVYNPLKRSGKKYKVTPDYNVDDNLRQGASDTSKHKVNVKYEDQANDSIYEDDDGYGIELDNSTSSHSRDETESTILLSSTMNNVTGSTSLTSFTDEGDHLADLRNRFVKAKTIRDRFLGDEVESETASDTEAEDDEFFESQNRLITTIIEE